MKETIYKSLILSLLITNIWSVVVFFTYYFEGSGFLHGFTTLLIFIWSCWITAVLGISTILLSFLKIWKSDKQKTFFLVLFGFTNLFFSILIIITLCYEIVILSAFFDCYLIVNLIIPFVVFFVLKRIIKKLNTSTIIENNLNL